MIGKAEWLADVLGVRLSPPDGRTASGREVRVRAADPALPPPGGEGLMGRPRSGAAVRALRPGPGEGFAGARGRKLVIAREPDGRVALTAPPPPVGRITFAGGGGKGAALPGAVRALHESGALKDIKEVNGASVGSLTASLVAAGATTEEFLDIANDPTLAPHIMEGKNMMEVMFGGRLTGEGMETLLRGKLDGVLRKRIGEYLEHTREGGGQPDAGVLKILDRLADGKSGPTFGEMRALSKVIPDVKEVKISGTYLAEVDPATGNAERTDRPQLAIFSADTEPDMEVALAARASAALPPIFKPVDILLSSGITARFEDGGVLNNVPTDESVGAGRDLDPMPQQGEMTFVFESGEARAAAKGEATPSGSALMDWVAKAPNSAAEYGTYRGLADRPDELVVVPLTVTVPPKRKGGKATVKDFSGLLSGTANFDIAQDDRIQLQANTEAATLDHIRSRQKPQTREFASEGEMLMSLGRDDLAALAQDGLEGAGEALAFRDAAVETIAGLEQLVGRLSGAAAKELAADKAVKAGLERLEKLAQGDRDRAGFIGREMNRSGGLDRLIAAARGSASAPLQAAGAVADGLAAQAHARTILRDMIYPRIVEEDPKGAGGLVLKQMDNRLRAALSPADVNAALKLGIEHFAHARDMFGRHGYRRFALALGGYVMKGGQA
jgi:exoenzyme U